MFRFWRMSQWPDHNRLRDSCRNSSVHLVNGYRNLKRKLASNCLRAIVVVFAAMFILIQPNSASSRQLSGHCEYNSKYYVPCLKYHPSFADFSGFRSVKYTLENNSPAIVLVEDESTQFLKTEKLSNQSEFRISIDTGNTVSLRLDGNKKDHVLLLIANAYAQTVREMLGKKTTGAKFSLAAYSGSNALRQVCNTKKNITEICRSGIVGSLLDLFTFSQIMYADKRKAAHPEFLKTLNSEILSLQDFKCRIISKSFGKSYSVTPNGFCAIGKATTVK